MLQAAVQRFGQAQAVQRLELAGEAGDQLGLVGLQMADHRPLQITQVLHRLPLVVGFLHLVFTQQPAAGLVGQADTRFIDGLAHRQQAHLFGVAADALAGGGNALLHHRQVVGEILDGFGTRVAPVLVVAGGGIRRCGGHGSSLPGAVLNARHEKPAIRCREGRETNGAVLLAGRSILTQLLLLCNISVLQVSPMRVTSGFRPGSGAD
ncbi:hypothetical protein D3C71_1153750 [compost metagenome]